MTPYQREQAQTHIARFKGRAYVYGVHCFEKLGEHARTLGSRAVVVASGFGKPWGPPLHERVREALASASRTLSCRGGPHGLPNPEATTTAREPRVRACSPSFSKQCTP